MASDSDFEEHQQPARRPVRDVDVAEIPRDADRRIGERSDLNADKQVFFFSKRLFEFISVGVSEERIQQTGQRHAAQKQGVLVRRAEQKNRADNLRQYAELKQLQKPPGPEHAANKRKRAARNKSTDSTMGRSMDARKRHASQESDQSQQPASSQRLDGECSQQTAPHVPPSIKIKRRRHLWATHPIPNPFPSDIPAVVLQPALPDVEKCNRKDSIRFLCEELCNDFTDEQLDDCVEVNDRFQLHSENYEVHSHILAIVIKRCTYLKTGNFFVRWIVDHCRQRFVLLCKQSNKLTGRKTEAKKPKVSDYKGQALEMQTRLNASDNVLWSGTNRLGMTKRIANCNCSITFNYEESEHVWHAKVKCASHTDHSDMKLPPKITLQTSVTELLQKLRRDVGVSVAQQIKFCANNNLHVTSDFIRRINLSTAADPAFGLSGDAGFIFALLSSQDKVDFCIEFELRDCHNRVLGPVISFGNISNRYTAISGGSAPLSRYTETWDDMETILDDGDDFLA